MKTLIIILSLAASAQADRGNLINLPRESIQNVMFDVCTTTVNYTALSISSSAPTLAVSGASVPWKKAWIQNQDGSVNLFWSISATVSTMTTSTDLGFKIVPTTFTTGGIFSDGLLPGASYYLMNDSNSKATTAVIKVCR